MNSVEKNLKFLALGDSYTIGERVAENERWPVLLVHEMNARGINIQNPRIIARTGWTTGELQEALLKENVESDYDLVSLLIGVNNQYRGLSVIDYQNEFEDLLKSAISLAKGDPKNVFVLSIPDYSITLFARDKKPEKISNELKKFNKVNRDVADNYNVKYLDITPLSQQAQFDLTLLADDQLHPSGNMYKKWVDFMTPTLLKDFS